MFLCLFTVPAGAGAESFAAWLTSVRGEAMKVGISAATFEAAMAGVRPLARVIALDRHQPESLLSFSAYRARFVNRRRHADGLRMMTRHADLLAEVSERFHVPASLLAALWGIESDYGRVLGSFPVIAALATLAHDRRRRGMFTSELLFALRLVAEGRLDPLRARGSWAGAAGPLQLLPSTIYSHGVDFNGDGRIDPVGELSDALATAARFLRASGWRAQQSWGAVLNEEIPGPSVRGGSTVVRRDGPDGPAFVVHSNFDVLLRWNRSTNFALTVGTLSDLLERRQSPAMR